MPKPNIARILRIAADAQKLRRASGGLVLNHVLLLTELAQGPAQPVELAALLGVATGSVTTMLDKLVQKGYATRKPEGNDRRKVLVEISYTEKTSYSNLTKI